MRGDGFLQPRPRFTFAGGRGFDPVEQALHAFLVDGEQKSLLAGDVKVDRARRHGGGGSEIAHGGGVVAALGELRRRGIEQSRPPVGLTFGGDCGHAGLLSEPIADRLV